MTGVHPGCKIHRVWLYPSRTATLGRIYLASNMHDPDVCFGGKRVKNHRSEHVLYFGELNTKQVEPSLFCGEIICGPGSRPMLKLPRMQGGNSDHSLRVQSQIFEMFG